MQDKLLKQAFMSGFIQQCEKQYRSLTKEAGVWGDMWSGAKNWYNKVSPYTPSASMLIPGGAAFAPMESAYKLMGLTGSNAMLGRSAKALVSKGLQPVKTGISEYVQKEITKIKSQAMPWMMGMTAAPFVSQWLLGPGGPFGPKVGSSSAQAGQAIGNTGRMQRSPMANKMFDYQKLNF